MKNMETKKCSKNSISKKWWLWTIVFIIVVAILANGNGGRNQGSHLYDQAEVKELMNGVGTEKIGEYSIIEAKSEDVTIEALTDWYFNYVTKNDFNYCLIIYTDRNDNSGVYSIEGVVEKDVIFTKEENGTYAISDAGALNNTTVYIPTSEKTLEELKF